MSEKFADVIYDGGKIVEASRENTAIYSHFGRAALYDYALVDIEDTNDSVQIWAQHPPDNPYFTALATAAVQHNAEIHVNLRKVPEEILKSFGKLALRDLDENPDWLPEI